MIPVLLLAAMASADPSYDRLFGGESAGVAAAPAEALPPSGFAWPALLAAGGVVAAWQLRKKALAGSAASGMRVIQRQVVGEKNSLLLVEVDDGSGGHRRLLLGSSQAGLALVQDLGAGHAESASPLTFNAPIPEIESAPAAAAPPARSAPDRATVARPSASQIKVQANAFADVLDEVLTERGIELDEVQANEDDNLAQDFFRAGAPAARGRFFTEDDLADEQAIADEPPKPVILRREPPVKAATAPVVAAPLRPAPVQAREIPAAPPSWAPAPAPAAAPNAGLRAILGGRTNAQLPANARIVSSYGNHRVNGNEAANESTGSVATPAAPSVLVQVPAAVAHVEVPVAPARTLVGPPLANPILLAAEPVQRAAPRTATLPPAPAPTALDASRARLQRLAQAVKPTEERPADLDHLLRRFDAVAAGGRR